MEKSHFEPIYKKSDSTNSNIKTEIPTGNLIQTVQISEIKQTNKKSRIPYYKNNNKKYKKNIRIAFKNIEEEEEDNNNNNSVIKYNKRRSNQMNSTYHLDHSNNNANNTNNNNENKGAYYKKKELNHINNHKSARIIYDDNNRHVCTQTNDNMISHRDLNNNQKRSVSRPQDSNPKKQRYQSNTKIEKNLERKKKCLYPSAYEGNQTEIMNGNYGNSKILNKNKNKNNVTNNYYGPIDIKNIVIGDSVNEINEILIEILQKNRVKFWNMSNLKFYCNINGENFIIEIFFLSNKLVVKDDKKNNDNKRKKCFI